MDKCYIFFYHKHKFDKYVSVQKSEDLIFNCSHFMVLKLWLERLI
jgi:hypothetical protein